MRYARKAGPYQYNLVTNQQNWTHNIIRKLPLLYNLRMYIQIFALVGGTSRRRVSPYKIEYLYIHEYLYNKILVSSPIKQSPFNSFIRIFESRISSTFDWSC